MAEFASIAELEIPVFGNSVLLDRLSQLCFNSFTGCIEIEQSTCRVWKIYTVLGRIAWAEGPGTSQRFLRQLAASGYPLSVERYSQEVSRAQRLGYGHYGILQELARDRASAPQGVRRTIIGIAQEVLFDALQAEARAAGEIAISPKPGARPEGTGSLPHTWLPTPEKIFEAAWGQWRDWELAGFAAINPNAIPAGPRLKTVQRELSRKGWRTLAQKWNGRRSLRDLAALDGRPTLSLMQGLRPYCLSGWIEWQAVPVPVAAVAPAPALQTVPAMQ